MQLSRGFCFATFGKKLKARVDSNKNRPKLKTTKEETMRKTHLLIIDPQNDFCHKDGSLYVTGAEKDMDRLALMINRLKGKLSKIHVTLDCHRKFDVAHPIYWVDSNGNHPNPFTVITSEDLRKGIWNVSVPSLYNRTMLYLQTLEANNRYDLMIWPPHCLIGSEGNNIYKSVLEAVHDWENTPGKLADLVSKGSNPFTEHYSAVRAEVPDPNDHTTQINTDLIKDLESADEVVVVGEALSHCVANTVKDIANNFRDEELVKKMVILTDASSPVPIAQNLADDFMREMVGRGMRTSTTVDYLR